MTQIIPLDERLKLEQEFSGRNFYLTISQLSYDIMNAIDGKSNHAATAFVQRMYNYIEEFDKLNNFEMKFSSMKNNHDKLPSEDILELLESEDTLELTYAQFHNDVIDAIYLARTKLNIKV